MFKHKITPASYPLHSQSPEPLNFNSLRHCQSFKMIITCRQSRHIVDGSLPGILTCVYATKQLWLSAFMVLLLQAVRRAAFDLPCPYFRSAAESRAAGELGDTAVARKHKVWPDNVTIL